MIGYRIKNTSKYKVEIIINNEKVFLDPKSEKKIFGNSIVVNNFKEFIIIEPIYKKEKPVKIETEENIENVETKENAEIEKTKEKDEEKKSLNNNESKPKRKRRTRKTKE